MKILRVEAPDGLGPFRREIDSIESVRHLTNRFPPMYRKDGKETDKYGCSVPCAIFDWFGHEWDQLCGKYSIVCYAASDHASTHKHPYKFRNYLRIPLEVTSEQCIFDAASAVKLFKIPIK